jgi:hypothetical protein
MHYITGIRSAGTLMAFGAHIGMSSNRIQRRPIVVDAGDGFPTMALATGKIGASGVNIQSSSRVTILTLTSLVKSYSLMRILQMGAASHLGYRWAIREYPLADIGNTDQGALATGPNFILLIIASAGLIGFVAS